MYRNVLKIDLFGRQIERLDLEISKYYKVYNKDFKNIYQNDLSKVNITINFPFTPTASTP